MWTDNETDRDFLNFTGTATTIAKMVVQATGRPVSIGVSGQWGVGKSSMIQLIQKELEKEDATDQQDKKFVFVEFNAWLYQGYDDARAALLDVIASTLESEAKCREKGIDKVRDFLKRVNWLRVARVSAETVGSLALGIPPGIFSEVASFIDKIKNKEEIADEELSQIKESLTNLSNTGSSLISPNKKESPPKEIQALRNNFEEVLEELEITLVVFVDDLDRCLPPTTISTLEAIRLFLFLKNTAFIVAADDKMIKHSVKKHFEGIDDSLVTNYFDKLIQVPIRVPALGIQEVRAYLFLLFVEDSSLDTESKEIIRQNVINQLSNTWKGHRVDKNFMNSIGIKFTSKLVNRLEMADRLANIMTISSKIKGNPRLIKRFLNALSIRMSISKSQGVGVDEAVLIKLLLFERCGPQKAYDHLRKMVSENEGGTPDFMSTWEEGITRGEKIDLHEDWNDEFVIDWLAIPPLLSNKDLRGALYVSREHAPLITEDDKLSTTAAEVLSILLTQPDMASSLDGHIESLQMPELSAIMDKVLEKANQEEEWGTPNILESCLALSKTNETLATRFAAFLAELNINQVKADIVPRIGDESWAQGVFDRWISGNVKGPVKKAISNYAS